MESFLFHERGENIEKLTLQNKSYRKVIYTGEFQLVLMSLLPYEDIPWETHTNVDQFIRVEKGDAIVHMKKYIEDLKKIIEVKYLLHDDQFVIIPAHTEHYIKNNNSQKSLKLYTIYSKPEHRIGTFKSRQNSKNGFIMEKLQGPLSKVYDLYKYHRRSGVLSSSSKSTIKYNDDNNIPLLDSMW
jgi:mannose-6-phosphate isomerase-like protein (cupin superfamily)